jgi:peroxiredoxin
MRPWLSSALRNACITAACLVVSSGSWAQAQAQAPKPLPPAPALQAKKADGQAFNLSSTRGKVVMVFYWSSACSVCLSHMPELRANLVGWRNKPFELVLVNVDRNMEDWMAHERITRTLETVRPTSVWSGSSPGGRLPVTLVINTKGQVIARHEGRIAPESWDEVAEALP